MTISRLLLIALLLANLLASPALAQELVPKHSTTEKAEKPGEPKVEVKPKPVSIKKWLAGVQRLGRTYDAGETDVQRSLSRASLIDELSEGSNGVWIKFRTKVKKVSWKDGFASVTTVQEFKNTVSKKTPLRVTRLQPIELTMTQEEAAAIKPGEKFEFIGKLKFHPGKWGLVGKAVGAQQMYEVRHKYLGGGYLGTFTATDLQCTLGRKQVQPRYAQKDAADDKE